MSFLIDTNIISEIAKGPRCNPKVAAWYTAVDESGLYLSSLVLGEFRKGVESIRPRDHARAQALESWLGEASAGFAGRILTVDVAVADEWGRMSAKRTIPVIDGLLAATAKVNRMTLVTRNDADLAGLGVMLLNPFKSRT